MMDNHACSDTVDEGTVRMILEERRKALARVPVAAEDGETRELLVIALGSESYAIDVSYVSEILPARPATPLPGLPAYWKGLMNYRGRLCPVLDLRAFLASVSGLPVGECVSESGEPEAAGRATTNARGGPAASPADGGFFIIAASATLRLAILVDALRGIHRMSRSGIGEPLGGDARGGLPFVASTGIDLISVLDIGAILSDRRLLLSVDGE